MYCRSIDTYQIIIIYEVALMVRYRAPLILIYDAAAIIMKYY